MYQPSRGAARRLGPCLRAYQARPQVRAEGKREGRGRGETLLSRRVGRSARSVSRRRTDVPPLLPTCAEQRVEGRGVSGTGGAALPACCRARDVCLPDLGGLVRWGASAFLRRLRGYLCLEVI